MAATGSDTRRRPTAAAVAATAATLATWAAVALVAGRPDSPLTPPLPPGGEAPDWLAGAAAAVGLDRLSRDAAALASLGALTAAGAAFLYSLWQAWRGRIPLFVALGVGVVLHVLAVALPLFLSRDVYSYAIYGRMVSIHGINPYVSLPLDVTADPFFPYVSRDWLDIPSVYGPAFVALSAGITRVVRSPAGAIDAYQLLAAGASVATMLLAAAAARRVLPGRAAFAALLVGWNPVVVLHGVVGGHSDALVGLAVAAAVLALLRGRPLLATGVMALGTLVKVSGGIPLAVLVAGAVIARPRPERARALAAHVGVAAGMAAPFVVPFLQARDPTLGVLNLTRLQGWLAPSRLLAVSLRRLGEALGSPVAGEVLWILVRIAFPLVFVVALVAVLRHLAREPGRIGPLVVAGAVGWMSLIGLMTSPLLLPWYVVWLIPLAWLLPAPGRVAAVGMSVAMAATELVAEPSQAPRAWEAMVLGVHYVATPLMLLLLVRLLVELRARLSLEPAPGLADPLLLEGWFSGGGSPWRLRAPRPVPARAGRAAGGQEVPAGAQHGQGDPAPRSPGTEPQPVGEERAGQGDGHPD